MTKNPSCVICKSEAEKNRIDGFIHYDCNRCGQFFITKEASQDFTSDLEDKLVQTKISGWIGENQNTKIESAQLEWLIKKLAMINVYEKAQKLLKWINAETPYPSHSVSVSIQNDDKNCLRLLSLCWAYNADELVYLIRYLIEEQYLTSPSDGNATRSVTITPHGYAYLEDFQKNRDSNLGFCAMWFDASVAEAWKKGFEPAIKKAGYNPRIINEHPHNGVIVDEIISSIRKSRFLIADLTGQRGGVYYEAGFAKGFGIEVIFTCRSDVPITELHFDVRHYNFLQWDANKYEELSKNLSLRIESTLGRGNFN